MLDKVRPTRNPVAIGIDTGGTHTDVVLVNGNDVRTLKVPTTPEDLNVGILEGIEKICSAADVDVSAVTRFAYATTYVTNLIVEEKETNVALLTTEGFRDVLEIGRASRKPDVYDINWRPAIPLVPRHLRFVAKERMDYRGEPITPLDEAGVRATLQVIRDWRSA
jgi:N-methylhydantoinase A